MYSASSWDDTEVKEGEDLKYYGMDVIWGHFVKQKSIFGKLEFDLLLMTAQLVFVLTHSNAGEERVFSMDQKNKTEARENLRFSTLNSILTVKMSNKDSIHFRLTQDVSKVAKSAPRDYNKKHVCSKSGKFSKFGRFGLGNYQSPFSSDCVK